MIDAHIDGGGLGTLLDRKQHDLFTVFYSDTVPTLHRERMLPIQSQTRNIGSMSRAPPSECGCIVEMNVSLKVAPPTCQFLTARLRSFPATIVTQCREGARLASVQDKAHDAQADRHACQFVAL